MYSICRRYSSLWWLGEGSLHGFGVTLSWAAIISFWHIKLWYKQNCVLSNKKTQKTFPLGHRVHVGKIKVRGRGLWLQFWGTGPPTSLSFSCRTRTMSPGSTPGAWSASPPKVIFCPCFMPLSTCTSRIFTSFTTFLPSHFLQRSFSLITSPGGVQRNNKVRERCRPRRHNHTEESLECLHHWAPYLLRYNQYTQTASVGPSLGPAVLSWCAYHAPYMLYISVQRPSCLPAYKHKHTHSVRLLGDVNMII